LEKFEEGNTGFPFIDAGVRQLKIEGWIHHILRNAVR
jgi:deoxyribodipyrimidine photolyase